MIARKAKNLSEAFEMENLLKDVPHGFIQWKGTDVCMDIYCKCGEHLHMDANCVYEIKCMECGTNYAVGCHIELIELEQGGNGAEELYSE